MFLSLFFFFFFFLPLCSLFLFSSFKPSSCYSFLFSSPVFFFSFFLSFSAPMCISRVFFFFFCDRSFLFLSISISLLSLFHQSCLFFFWSSLPDGFFFLSFSIIFPFSHYPLSFLFPHSSCHLPIFFFFFPQFFIAFPPFSLIFLTLGVFSSLPSYRLFSSSFLFVIVLLSFTICLSLHCFLSVFFLSSSALFCRPFFSLFYQKVSLYFLLFSPMVPCFLDSSFPVSIFLFSFLPSSFFFFISTFFFLFCDQPNFNCFFFFRYVIFPFYILFQIYFFNLLFLSSL